MFLIYLWKGCHMIPLPWTMFTLTLAGYKFMETVLSLGPHQPPAGWKHHVVKPLTLLRPSFTLLYFCMEDSERQFWIHNLGPCVFICWGQQVVAPLCFHWWNFLCQVPLPRPPLLQPQSCPRVSAALETAANQPQCLHLDIAPPQKWQHIKRSVPMLWGWLHFFNMLSD